MHAEALVTDFHTQSHNHKCFIQQLSCYTHLPSITWQHGTSPALRASVLPLLHTETPADPSPAWQLPNVQLTPEGQRDGPWLPAP